ncbi:MAG: hypothetical protein ACX939_01040, partial [Hyphococcus sp.]
LDKAIALFPPQTSIETFDPQLAAAAAWLEAANALAVSEEIPVSRTGSPTLKKARDLDINARITWNPPRPASEDCTLDWRREPPKFPADASREGYVGAVLIGYHVEGARVAGARVLAEAPAASTFGEVSLASMDDWTLEAEAPAHCQANRLAVFKFVFAN